MVCLSFPLLFGFSLVLSTNTCAARDDAEAIDQSNVISSRTRGAKAKGGYAEPGDEEGLPSEDGTSSTR